MNKKKIRKAAHMPKKKAAHPNLLFLLLLLIIKARWICLYTVEKFPRLLGIEDFHLTRLEKEKKGRRLH